MNWSGLIGKKITVDGIKMKVTDYCKTCRRLWAEDRDKSYYLKVDRWENYKMISEKIKPLE